MSREHPILKTTDTHTVVSKYSKDPWILVECLETGLVYLDNPVGYDKLESEYAWEKTYEQEKIDRKEREPVFSMLSALSKKIRYMIRKTPKSLSLPIKLTRNRFYDKSEISLLDVGCGTGEYPRNISQKISKNLGIKVIPRGIEISKVMAEKANTNLSEMDGGVLQAAALEGITQLEDGSFDLIIMQSFLEHEVNPLDLLKACRKKMQPEGLLIIKVPNYSCWNRKVRQGKWCGFRYPDHVNYFSPNNMKIILEKAGMKIYRMNFFDRMPTSDNMWVIAELG